MEQKNVTPESIIVKFSDGSTVESDDFVAVVGGEEFTDTKLHRNCDAFLLGQTVQLAAVCYHEELAALDTTQQEAVKDALNSAIEIAGATNMPLGMPAA